VTDVVLVQEVEYIHSHADVLEPRPLLWVRHNLLFRITICVVDQGSGL
jgi:hypothetical protein